MKLVLSLPFSVVALLFLLGWPAQAAKLQSWKFDAQRQELEIITDEDVQPTAQLVPDPARLVIDLPGIALEGATIHEALSGTVRSIRIGQFDSQTTRLVIELAPGYTLEPNQVKFRGVSARQWVVTLPAPIAATPQPGMALEPTATPLAQAKVIKPATPPAIAATSTQPTALINAIELDEVGNQLVIRADQPLRYTSRWERSQGVYRLEILAARISPQLRPPTTSPTHALQQLRIIQTGDNVVLLVRPGTRVNLGQVNQVSQQVLVLPFARSPLAQRPTPPAPTTPLAPPRPVLAPSAPTTPPAPTWPTPATPAPTPQGKLVVIIDPGHGGPDPGAVGIGGLQEKGIVLDIGTQVASILQQYGVYALLTRADDRDLDLEPRVQMAEQVHASAFVSIHANSIDLSRPDISGLETYYYQSGADLAQTIHQNVLYGTGIQDRGVRTARFYVLRKTSMPSVLVEVGFVTGRDDAQKLSNSSYRTQMATAIARGILQYLQRTARR